MRMLRLLGNDSSANEINGTPAGGTTLGQDGKREKRFLLMVQMGLSALETSPLWIVHPVLHSPLGSTVVLR